jgi:hypothetical protein
MINKSKSRKKKIQTTDLVKRVVQSLNSQAETKYFDQFSSANLPATGVIACLSDVTRGTDVTQRIGNQITFTRIDLRIYVKISTAAGVQAQAIRCLLVLDTMGANAPIVADILDAGFLGSTYTQSAPYYWDYRKRFRILYDQVFALNDASNQSENHFKAIPLKVVSQNIGAATTFKNQIYIVLVSNEPNVLQLPTFWYTTRLYFRDE